MKMFYRLLIRLHPPYFRDRFGDEMQVIYEHEVAARGPTRLVLEAAVSVLRQWLPRPEYWHAPLTADAVQSPTGGVPVFAVLGEELPGPGVLVRGGACSLALFAIFANLLGSASSSRYSSLWPAQWRAEGISGPTVEGQKKWRSMPPLCRPIQTLRPRSVLLSGSGSTIRATSSSHAGLLAKLCTLPMHVVLLRNTR
jgi:hypothetical protein